ncbi:MAG: hydrogenase maturation protease [Desulfobacteraceae bacterium]|nr:MAG: hydrogenase maturation protease [Desulfobacteraceae bacterium]
MNQHGVQPKALLIGVGNEYRGDDGVGIFIVRHPGLTLLPGIHVEEEMGEGSRLMELWKDAGTVFLFDAVRSGNRPGSIYRFDAVKEKLPRELFSVSTHSFGVLEAIALSRALNQLPGTLIIFGIEGRNFDPGKGLSKVCEQAALEVIRSVRREIRSSGFLFVNRH